jgi:CRP-like cAMP-binding protein
MTDRNWPPALGPALPGDVGSLGREHRRARADASFSAGAILVREGDPGDSFLIIREGSATVEQAATPFASSERRLPRRDLADTHGRRRTATVIAEQAVDAWTIDRAGFTRLMDEYPSVRYELLNALTQRIRSSAPASPLD